MLDAPGGDSTALGIDAGPDSHLSRPNANERQAFGFLLIGGVVVGAQVRDIRLANELARRGYPVHVWWAMDRPKQSLLAPTISQRWLFSAGRYAGLFHFPPLDDRIGRWISRLTSDWSRQRFVQHFPSFFDWMLRELIRRVCSGVANDKRLIRRFADELTQSGVTCVLPNLECLAPFAAAACQSVPNPIRFLVTFQGFELYATYARELGCEAVLYERLLEVVTQSEMSAIAVSDAYAARIRAEVGVHARNLTVIPPGVPVEQPMDATRAEALTRECLPGYRPGAPLVSYIGRRDSEKGIDLLLYAARILRGRGVPMQLAICGPTAFGRHYAHACEQIAENLQVPVLWSDYISDEMRSAVFRMSRVAVCPSIHEEPFGMAPVEAMMQGTPVVVPDTGGIAGLVRIGDHEAGLLFRSWDSADLATQLEKLLTNSELHASCAVAAPVVAEHFSVERLGARILDHLGLPHVQSS